MADRKILVVESNRSIQKSLKMNMEKAGWNVEIANSGETALLTVPALDPDIILLGLELSGLNGIETCRQLKNYPTTHETPIIMLAKKDQENESIKSLNEGADDFITKPINPELLHAKIKTILRRSTRSRTRSKNQPIQLHNLYVNPLQYGVEVDGKSVKLTRNDFRLLLLFVRNPGRVFSRFDILLKLHGTQSNISKRSVDVQIVGLRKKIAPAGYLIETVHGVGYRIKEVFK